jgi:POT family proton-dependent oligopeptide transporter
MSRAELVASSSHGELFGHPRGLAFLFATEMWERFSYYGMRSLLVLYMVKYLLVPGADQYPLGFSELKSVLESVFGPLDVQPLASHIYGLYGGLVYATPLLGGLLADRVLGQHRTVVLGACLMALGHFMMAFAPFFLLALLLLILGNGAFKPNISAQVGGLYGAGDQRRDRGYSIFYVGINLGAFIAPLVCGTLGETAGWHYGFAAAGIGMLIGLAIYLCGVPALPPERRRAGPQDRALGRTDRRAVVALLIVFAPVMLFSATYEQQGNTIALWADHADRTVDLLVWRGEIPTPLFQSFNPLLIFLLTPLVVSLWTWQAARNREPAATTKMALGCLAVALSNLLMAAAAWRTGDDRASWVWLLGYFVLITLGELYVVPMGLALVARVAPRQAMSVMMGAWLGAGFVGNLLGGWIGSFWTRMEKPAFFLLLAVVACAASIALWLVGSVLGAVLRGDARQDGPAGGSRKPAGQGRSV